MKRKMIPAFFRYGRSVIVWLLLLIFYFLGLLAYGRILQTEAVPVYLSSYYPDGGRAKEILESEKGSEHPRGICFYWDGGRIELSEPLQGRRTEALLGGICGDAMWYDIRSNGFSDTDPKGCLMDEETASVLFGGADPIGRNVEINGQEYQVRRVLPWKQKLVLIARPDSETVYTKLFLQIRQGESRENAVSTFLLSYGLKGKSAEEGSIYVSALLALLLFPGAMIARLFYMAVRERNRYSKGKQRWIWNLGLLFLTGTLLFLLWQRVEIPRDWIPGKWSDFQFFPDKWNEVKENIRLYLMMPKTIEQAENLIWTGKSIGCSLLSFFLFCYSCVDSRRYGAYDGTKWRWRYDIYSKKNKNKGRDHQL